MSRVVDNPATSNHAVQAATGTGRQAFLQSLSQHARLFSLETSLGPGALAVERFSGREEMSDLFRFDIDCIATSAAFELKAIVGEEVSLRVMQPDGKRRAFHGIVTRAKQLGADGSLARYGLTLEPWMHALTLRRDSFVFQDKTVLEILAEIFFDYPSANYLFEVDTALPKRSLTIQYRETDYAFARRILAEEGLSFYFRHADSTISPDESGGPHGDTKSDHARHQLVVFDDNARIPACEQPIIRFHRVDATEKDDTITCFTHASGIHTNSVTLGSWDYKKVAATHSEDSANRHGDSPLLEVFEGGSAYRFTDNTESARIARARAESLGLQHHAMRAESSVRALATGTWFSLSGHPDADGEYVVLSIFHEGANNISAGMKALGTRIDTEAGTYRNHFSCIRRSIPVRPSFWHPKPTAPGTQVAVVVGVKNEEITTERDHRIKVQFPWQRGDKSVSGQLLHPTLSNAPGNETAGTWIRVAEPAAGANWGSHFVPRIGQEVCIEFIAGDIDRPVVTGRLYNGADAPPFHGADNHPGAMSGIKTKEYAAGGFNAWMVDDTPGQLRQAVAASYSASQLNVGYLLRHNGNIRGGFRGTGFELATDAWSTLRAKRGMFVSTSQRDGAVSTQLDTQEAQGKLKAAEEIAKALSDAAAQHHALPLSTPQGLQQFSKTISGNDSVDGQQAPKFAQHLTLIDSQASISVATPASSTLFAGQDMTLNASATTRVTAGQAATLAAAKTASLFTHAGGSKVFAAKEPVSIRAHTGPMDVLADKALTVTSSNASIKVQAKQEVLLASGGGYIKLAGSNIDIHCPASVSIKGVVHDFLGAKSEAANLMKLPDESARDPAHWIALHYLEPETGEGVDAAEYEIHFEGGPVVTGTLDKNGKAHHKNVMNKKVKKVLYKPRPAKKEKNAAPLEALNDAQ
ncbi:type VI secretion system Vgr family protein [Noviherbaspirillum agri]